MSYQYYRTNCIAEHHFMGILAKFMVSVIKHIWKSNTPLTALWYQSWVSKRNTWYRCLCHSSEETAEACCLQHASLPHNMCGPETLICNSIELGCTKDYVCSWSVDTKLISSICKKKKKKKIIQLRTVQRLCLHCSSSLCVGCIMQSVFFIPITKTYLYNLAP